MAVTEEVVQGLIKDTAANTARLDNLEVWQTSQNGAIHRVEDDVKKINDKFSKLGWAVAATLFGVTAELVISVLFFSRGLKM